MMSAKPSSRYPLPARVAGLAPGGRLALLVCAGVEGYGDGIRVEIPAELAPPDCRAAGADLLVGWDRPGEDAPVAWAIRLPCYELEVHLPGPFAEEDYRPLIERVVPAINEALRRHGLGDESRSYTGGPGSEDFSWECQVLVNDLRRAIAALREVLAGLGVQQDSRIDVRPGDGHWCPVRSYPLAARGEAEDWSDFADVESAARWPRDAAVASQVPCW